MATYYTGEKFGVYAKVGADWLLAVCTTSISISRSRNEIEVQNNCTGGAIGKLASTQSNSISFEGDITTDPGALEIGFLELNDQFELATVSEWKIENDDDSIQFYAAEAFISTFDGTFPVGDKSTFSIALSVSGALSRTVPV
jgi:ethanolamine utilization microcompartment shell protein EutS